MTDSKGAAKADTTVTLKDRKNGTATGATDKSGMLTLPATEHKAYIVGYDDGTFKPDSNMSRAEAAAIFARLIAEAKDETVSGKYKGKHSILQVGTGDSPLTIPFYEKCGFIRSHSIKNFFTDNYDHPIYEAGTQLVDMIYLQKKI